MKKVKLTIVFLLLAVSSMMAYSQLSEIKKVIPDDPGAKVRCKCKHGGCYAGRWLSVRFTCASGSTVKCRDWKDNCYNRE